MYKPLVGAILIASSSTAVAEQINHVDVGIGFDQGLSVVGTLAEQYRLAIGNDGIALDYLIRQGSFDDPKIPVDWYVGVGGWKEWNGDGDFGPRIPLGIRWDYNRFKFYGQVHPELNLESDVKLQLGAAVGVMYNF
jgi:hypothetical protein